MGNDVTGATGMTVAGAGWMRAMGNDGGRGRMDEGDGGDGMMGVGLRSGGV